MRTVYTVLQANIVTEEIVIPPKFYNSLIGARGKLIHAIMEDCGGVAIKFPQAESRSDKVSQEFHPFLVEWRLGYLM
jgi:hypothetical protein